MLTRKKGSYTVSTSKQNPIVAALTAALRRAPISRYRISQVCGVSEPQLSRLYHGTAIPNLRTAEKIAQALGYRITLTPIQSPRVQKDQRKGK